MINSWLAGLVRLLESMDHWHIRAPCAAEGPCAASCGSCVPVGVAVGLSSGRISHALEVSYNQGIPRYPKLAAWFIGKSIISMVYKWGTPILVPLGPGIIQAHGSGSPLVRSRPYSTKESIEDTHISWPYIKLIQQVAKAWHAWPGVHVELGTSAWSLTINYWIIILVCIYTYTYSNSMDNNSMVRRVNSCWHPCHVQSFFLARKITSINDMCKAVRDLQLM